MTYSKKKHKQNLQERDDASFDNCYEKDAIMNN